MRSSLGPGSGLVSLIAEDPRLVLMSEDGVANDRLKGLLVAAGGDEVPWRVLQNLDLFPKVFRPAGQGSVHGAVGRQPADDNDFHSADLIVILTLFKPVFFVLLVHSEALDSHVLIVDRIHPSQPARLQTSLSLTLIGVKVEQSRLVDVRLELDLRDQVRIGFFDLALKVELRLLVDEDRGRLAFVHRGDVAEPR